MSQLPPQAIDEFQVLWKKHFGKELPREEAAARAHQTFIVLRMLIDPVPDGPHIAQVPSNAKGWLNTRANPRTKNIQENTRKTNP